MALVELVLSKLVALFETYRGHDQTLSLIGYSCKMLSGINYRHKEADELRKKFQVISSQISNCRVILRLLDDVSMLGTTLSYGLGSHEKNFLIRMFTLADNIASHFYYVCEHIAWLGDNQIIKVNSNKYWLLSLLAWFVSLISTITTNSIYLLILIKKHQFSKSKFNEKDDGDGGRPKKNSPFLSKNFVYLYLKLIKDVFYLINAIHWLPPGILWSGKLSNFTSGLVGVISALSNLTIRLAF